jgi:hypothetical protein
MSWVMPFPEKSITGEYGTMSAYRRKNGLQAHSGTDWSPAGSNKGKTLIPAIANGTIKLIHYSKFLGWVVVQTAADKDGKIWYIGYCHLKCKKHGINCKGGHGAEEALDVKLGDKVKAGDVSHGMTMGNTGVSSSGVHLHATLAKTVKGVFGMTTDKYDLKKAIKANGGEVAPKVDKKTTKAIIKGTPAPAPKKEATAPVVPAKSAEPTRTPSSNVGPLSQDDWKAFQEILKRDHGYTGAIDGVPGPVTNRSLQRSVVAHGYNGPIDGDPGANTYRALQRRLVSKGLYEGRIDGTLGNATYAAWREAIQKNLY